MIEYNPGFSSDVQLQAKCLLYCCIPVLHISTYKFIVRFHCFGLVPDMLIVQNRLNAMLLSMKIPMPSWCVS